MTWIVENWHLIVALILGFYEVLVRIVPTVGSWSILAWIIRLLQWISDGLDRKRK